MGKTLSKNQRDPNIRKAFSDELDLTTKTVKSKKVYTRKSKYKEY